eukprot:Skav216254  [mRNA]  locus=scaffold20:222178:226213:- [translate_table: standard]
MLTGRHFYQVENSEYGGNHFPVLIGAAHHHSRPSLKTKELIPLEELGRPRVDALCSLSASASLYRFCTSGLMVPPTPPGCNFYADFRRLFRPLEESYNREILANEQRAYIETVGWTTDLGARLGATWQSFYAHADTYAGGIFRDSFANVVELLDDALQRAARADEPIEQNFELLEEKDDEDAALCPGAAVDGPCASGLCLRISGTRMSSGESPVITSHG